MFDHLVSNALLSDLTCWTIPLRNSLRQNRTLMGTTTVFIGFVSWWLLFVLFSFHFVGIVKTSKYPRPAVVFALRKKTQFENCAAVP